MGFTIYPDPDEVIHSPGLLYLDPTDLSQESGYGTLIGSSETGLTIESGLRYALLSGEENGDEPIEKIYLGARTRMKIALMNYNATSLSLCFPGLVSGTSVKVPQINSGTSVLPWTGHILFIPENLSNPIFLAQKAAGNIVQSFSFRRKNFTVFHLVFDLFRKTDDNDGIYYMGPISGAVIR